MTQTEEYELAILRIVVPNGKNGKGGMRVREIKQIFYDLFGNESVGEEFFTYMIKDYITYGMVEGEAMFLPTALGGFRLMDLEKMVITEKEEKAIQTRLIIDSKSIRTGTVRLVIGTIVIIVLTGILIYLEYNPPHHKEDPLETHTTRTPDATVPVINKDSIQKQKSNRPH